MTNHTDTHTDTPIIPAIPSVTNGVGHGDTLLSHNDGGVHLDTPPHLDIHTDTPTTPAVNIHSDAHTDSLEIEHGDLHTNIHVDV